MPPDELSSEPVELIVTEDQAGRRLDVFLASQFPRYSRAHLRRVIDAAGVTIESYDPIPLVGIGPGTATMLLGVMTTGLSGARSNARVAMSLSNLRQIGVATMTYHADHNRMPANLGELVTAKMLDARVLVSPASGKAPPKVENGEVVGPALAQVRASAQEKQREAASSLGTQHLRGAARVPKSVRCFT